MNTEIKSMKVRFYTLGCRLNQYEANAIANAFQREGFVLSDSDEADIYVVSGCVVTAEAERKTRQFLRRAKRRNPDAVVVSVGCYAQMRGSLYADISVGNRLKHRVVDFVKNYIHTGKTIVSIKNLNTYNTWDELEIDEFYGHTRAWVKIQDGCNHFCSYCVIPIVRGREISRPIESVVNEVKRLVSRGFSEIVLTGINIGRYGFDWHERDTLSRLIEVLSEVDGLKRLRLSSIEPFTITDRLIDTVVGLPNVCNHLHIPLQSGNDDVLRAMKRGYNSAFFLNLVDNIRDKEPWFNVTTDLIVGFPGEDEAAFEDSLSVLREAMFGRVHVFPFSERPGTPASRLSGKIDRREIKRRVSVALDVAKGCAGAFRKQFLNTALRVIVERISGNGAEGWTDNYLRVKIQNLYDIGVGDAVYVKVKALDGNYLLGYVVAKA